MVVPVCLEIGPGGTAHEWQVNTSEETLYLADLSKRNIVHASPPHIHIFAKGTYMV